ncbi:hypothetical protein QEH56_08955 [Pelagicoccus enzymogenes]|uniref:esterase/lipase family protein n=1 Tax=Pelagicoccus enzymogenes TaxID=2773457 RepID=UPI00280DD8C5|nr:hypothetical protein [Pelagicoccus enzymogenes]MDQ8198273.1 hypothetical protein [Pelagicoccus enzymogenes]
MQNGNASKVEQCVALLHGLCRRSHSMEPLRSVFEESGYVVRNIGYPSTRYCLSELAEQTRPEIDALSNRFSQVHFVTHSMGGILLRQMQATRRIRNLGRCVMLAPPNRGSQVVDRLRHWAPFRWVNGPAGGELGTGADSVPRGLGPVDFEVGVIAGNRSINLILSQLLPKPNDGKVAVSHTQVEGQRDFRVFPATHPCIMKNQRVQANALAFIQTGAFLAS